MPTVIGDKVTQFSTRAQGGFTYLALMFLIAIIGLAAAASVQLGAISHRRDAEAQLIHTGQVYKLALGSYLENTPEGMGPHTAPKRLEDLLRDPRFPFVKRHIRQLFADPITGKADWRLIYDEKGGIIGVFSRSKEKPIRVDNFPDEFFYFARKKTYSDWQFVYGVPCDENVCMLPPQPSQLN